MRVKGGAPEGLFFVADAVTTSSLGAVAAYERQ